VTSNVERYQRIAPVYDLLDLPFERRRYRALRPLLFRGMAGRLLDAGVGTGRNCEFTRQLRWFPGSTPAPRCSLGRRTAVLPSRRAAGSTRWYVTALEFRASSFDAAVASFLFCVLPEQLQVPALRELVTCGQAGRPYPPSGVCAPARLSAPDRLIYLAAVDQMGLRREL